MEVALELLKKPANLSLRKAGACRLESEDAGFVQRFRHIIRQLVNIFDHTHSEAQPDQIETTATGYQRS